jgi:hypothetical protein
LIFSSTKSLQKKVLTEGFTELHSIHFPASRTEPLQYLINQDLEGHPPTHEWLNRRFRLVEMVSYIGFRSALLTLLLVSALDISGFIGNGSTLPWMTVAIEVLAGLIMLISIPFRNSPFWLMEPPHSPYIDKIVARNPPLIKYRKQLRALGRSETLMECALYLQHDQLLQQENRQGSSRLKRSREQKRAQKQSRRTQEQ